MFLLFAEGFFPLVYIVIRIPDDMPGTGISKARHGKTWQDMARHGKTGTRYANVGDVAREELQANSQHLPEIW